MSSPSTTHGAPAHHEHQDGGIGRLFLIYGLLLVLTGTTFLVSLAPIGHYHLHAAVFIASIKVTLVVLFFMHLWHSDGSNRIVFVVSFFFLIVLLFFVLADVATRFPLSNSRILPRPNVDQQLLPSGMPPGMGTSEGHR